MTVHTFRWRIAYARRLLHRARALLSDASPFAAAEAAAACQDGVEMALWALADENGLLPKKKRGDVTFHDLLSCVPSAAPYVKALEHVNQLRVYAKHFGSSPDREEIQRQVERAEDAIRDISTKEPPHLDVTCAFLGSALRNRLVAAFLEDAERLIDEEDRKLEFTQSLACARYFVLSQAQAALQVGNLSHRFSSWYRYDGRDRETERALRSLAEHTRKAVFALEDQFAQRVLIADRRDELLIEHFLPVVNRYADGHLEVSSRQEIASALTAERSSALFLAVVRAAEQAEALATAVSSLELERDRGRRVEIVRSGDGIVRLGSRERVIAHLEPGDKHVFWRPAEPDDSFISVSIFGTDSLVPVACVKPTSAEEAAEPSAKQ